MTLSIEFERIEDGDFSPFDLGNIKIKSSNLEINSSEDPRYAMMIFISITGLIHAILSACEGNKKYEFVGVDSSFSILFFKHKKEILAKRRGTIIKASRQDFMRATANGVDRIIAKEKNNIDPSHAVFMDLADARERLDKAGGFKSEVQHQRNR